MKKMFLAVLIFLGQGIFLHGIEKDEELFNAIENDEISRVKDLIKQGVNINSTAGLLEGTPLLVAVRHYKGNDEIIDALLEAGANVGIGDKFGITPLIEASGKEGGKNLVEKLLSAGADINKQAINDGWTALMLAIETDRVEIAKSLVNNEKIDLEVKNSSGKTALDFAKRKNNVEIINLIKSKMESKPQKEEQAFMENLQLLNQRLFSIQKVLSK